MIKIFIGKEKQNLECPPATQDLELNTKNRDAAIKADHIQYGPLNVDEPGDYWKKIADYWNTDEKAAKKSLCGNCVAFDISPRMKDCMPGETSDDDGELGYCWMHHFKCHSARSCRTWAKGGPINKDKKSMEWQQKNKKSLEEEKTDKKMSPDEAIAKEGGALGFSKWEELTGKTRDELEKYVKDNDHIKIHRHGDIINTKGLNEDIELTEDVAVYEGKICPKGKAWAMRKYGKWSAYAAMGASKYCKDPNYGKGKKKKNEEVQEEGELKKWRDENWVQSDGTPCGDAKAQKNPKRCKPKSKWATMSKGEKAADNRKKKAGGKKGKQFVSATKKGKVTKSHTKESKNMKISKEMLKQIIKEEFNNFLEESEQYYHITDATYDDGTVVEDMEFWDDVLEEAEYQGRKVTLNKPMKGDVKKSKVYVKDPKTGNVKKVNFGDPNMKIRKSNPKARKSFRARHNCDNPGPKTKARYWSCRAW